MAEGGSRSARPFMSMSRPRTTLRAPRPQHSARLDETGSAVEDTGEARWRVEEMMEHEASVPILLLSRTMVCRYRGRDSAAGKASRSCDADMEDTSCLRPEPILLDGGQENTAPVHVQQAELTACDGNGVRPRVTRGLPCPTTLKCWRGSLASSMHGTEWQIVRFTPEGAAQPRLGALLADGAVIDLQAAHLALKGTTSPHLRDLPDFRLAASFGQDLAAELVRFATANPTLLPTNGADKATA